uniref:CSON004521 protein n=1 Tax=Culicoides sonorensis TaxID=179676 RepID=A0A336MRD9_CULSO
MSEFETMRTSIAKDCYIEGLLVELEAVWPLAQTIGLKWSRYHLGFEIGYLAGGGFGKILKTRHNVIFYLAKVRTLASLNHANIVSYKETSDVIQIGDGYRTNNTCTEYKVIGEIETGSQMTPDRKISIDTSQPHLNLKRAKRFIQLTM